ncbi:hypothetical protein [Parabacteroides goldsteinii]|uniref:hypothetical protein n=1 Tax=Parabacteroides goldsteinii TaxID=328812 RepID=UPI0025B67A3A|nr:hypothetical protein [Parabacteroides goldsteinii]
MFELGEEGKLEIVSVDDFLSLADMDDKEDLKEGENAGGEDGGNDKSTEEEGATADDTNNNTSNEGAGNNEEEEVKIPKTDYKGILSDLMSRGIINDISDYEFQVGENDEDKVSFKDLSIEDKESFLDLIENVIKEKESGLLKDKIDTSSVSDFTRQLIEAEKSGANVNQILGVYRQYQAPIQDLDLSVKEDQMRVIRHFVNSLPISDEEKDEQMEIYKSQSDEFIEAKAKKFKGILDEKMKEYIQKQKEDAEKKKKEDEEASKRYRKDLRTEFNSSYELNEKMLSRLTDFALKIDDKGETGVLRTFKESMRDPKKAVDLIMYLMSPDEFIKQKSNKRVKQEQIKVIKMLGRTNKSRSSNNEKTDEDGLDLSGAIKID